MKNLKTFDQFINESESINEAKTNYDHHIGRWFNINGEDWRIVRFIDHRFAHVMDDRKKSKMLKIDFLIKNAKGLTPDKPAFAESVNESFSKQDWDIKWKLPKDTLWNSNNTIKNTNIRTDNIRDLLKSKPNALKDFENDDAHPTLTMSYDELMKWYKALKESVNEASNDPFHQNFKRLYRQYADVGFLIQNTPQDSRQILNHIKAIGPTGPTGTTGREYFFVDMSEEWSGGKFVVFKHSGTWRSIYEFDLLDAKTLKKVSKKPVDMMRGQLKNLQVALKSSSHQQSK